MDKTKDVDETEMSAMSATVQELQTGPTKVAKRSDYVKGIGYEVTLRLTIHKTRVVRATNPDQAMDFAEAREALFAPKYFGKKAAGVTFIEDIEAIDCVERDSPDEN